MELLLNIVLCIFLLVLVFQDFRYRAIHVLIVMAVFIISCSLLWIEQKTLMSIGKTVLFISVTMISLWGYISIKNGTVINPFRRAIGIGDVLFFLAITPLFSLFNYMIFFITGMLISILFVFFFGKFTKNKLIPLAGILSAYLVLIKVASIFISENLFYTTNLLVA